MRRTLSSVFLGLSGGLLLSASRAMPGYDLVSFVGPTASRIADLRALPLVLLAVALVPWTRGPSAATWLALAAGFAAHGAFVGPRADWPWLILIVAIVGALVAARVARDPEDEHRAPREPEDGEHALRALEALGLIVAGGGAAVAVEAIARHARQFGAGLAQDDTVTGTIFLAFGAFGAAAFGWMGGLRATRRLAFPVALTLVAISAFASLAFVDSIVDGFRLSQYMKRVDLSLVDFGGLRWNMWLGAGAFVLPGLAAGAAFASARGRSAAACAVFGAAVGVWIVPRLFDNGAERGLDEAELFSSQIVPLAALIAAAGGGLAALAEERRKPIARYVALALVGACALVPLFVTVKPIVSLSPWEGRAILPYLTYESPVGLVTVEPSRFALKIARIDRRAITPDRDEVEADLRRLRDAFELVPVERRSRGELRVLFVGQLTPIRSEFLASQGATHVDRTAAWWRTMPRIEAELYRGPEGQPSMPLPTGDVLDPDAATLRLERGDYDLVVAASVAGDAPALASVEAPARTTIVRWIAIDVPLRGVKNPAPLASDERGQELRPRVVFSAAGLAHPSFGFVDNGQLATADLRRFEFVEDRAVESPFGSMRIAWGLRTDRARAAAVAALGDGGRAPVDAGAPDSELRAALVAFYDLQQNSSPFESPGQRVELDTDTLERLEKATLVGPLDSFLRSTWEWIASVLLEKRDVASIDRFLAPIARLDGPWTWVEIALAQADLEGLEPAAAAQRLEALVRREPGNFAAWFRLGEAKELLGDASAAAGAFRGATQVRPNDEYAPRRLALALTRAGDPEGPRLAQELLAHDPADEDLKACAAGKPPPAPKTYQPSKRVH